MRVAHKAVALAQPSGLVDHGMHRQDCPVFAEEQVQVPVFQVEIGECVELE